MTTNALEFINEIVRSRRAALILAIALCLAIGGMPAGAQSSKAAKETESLAKAGEDAKKSIEAVVQNVGKMLSGYNSLLSGEAKNAQSTYKKLVSDLKSTEKMIQGAQKSVDGMDKQAKKYFSDWEKELGSFTDESMKQKSMDRLTASKEKYDGLGQALGEAGAAFAPLVENLSQQILMLGRDMSPEAIADLQDEAAGLNQQAQEVTDQVKSLVSGS